VEAVKEFEFHPAVDAGNTAVMNPSKTAHLLRVWIQYRDDLE
jgi:hypothetical protein